MSFAARTPMLGNTFLLNPGVFFSSSGYLSGTYGTVSPDPVSLFSGTLNRLIHSSSGTPGCFLTTAGASLPSEFTSVDVFVNSNLYRSLPRVGAADFSLTEAGLLTPFTLGVPVTVQLLFR